MFPVVFTPAARAELIEAQDWYGQEVPGVGRRFRQETNRLVERISATPQQFPLVFKSVRRALLHRFPYALFFVMDENALTVIACFHASRDPMHWQNRV